VKQVSEGIEGKQAKEFKYQFVVSGVTGLSPSLITYVGVIFPDIQNSYWVFIIFLLYLVK